jgi:argininosuccinate lyase
VTESSGKHKLWGGRFSVAPAAALEALNRSITTDFRRWPFDVRLSQAWAVGLWGAGVLTLEESRDMERGLALVAEKLENGAQPLPSDEDVHTMIDRLLHEEIGDLASKLHTGRSRNDQVATATRLWIMNACEKVDASIRALQRTMLDHAEQLTDVPMPAYTHLQRAQPVAAANWMLSHFWPLERDRTRFASTAKSASVLPLGSGAVAGCAYPVSRVLLQGSLGFASITQNSMDAVSDRDFVAEMLFALAMLGAHLSRLGEDLILFGSTEFSFVKFGDAFSTGSSMMPQKRNPDALELARASGPLTLGQLTALMATIKGLPTGYNKDLQNDKRALFEAADMMLLVLPAVAGALAEIRFQPTKMRAAISASMMATDLADYLVSRGASFREAHSAIGRLVRESEQSGVELDALPSSSFTSAHPLFEESSREWLDVNRSIERRDVPGATGPNALQTQIAEARAALQPHPEVTRGNELNLRVS